MRLRQNILKVVVLGDQGVGTTTLISTYCGTSVLDTGDTTSQFKPYITTITVKKKKVKLKIFDLPTDEEIMQIMQLEELRGAGKNHNTEIAETDIKQISDIRHDRHNLHRDFRASVFMICFSVDNPDSLEHAINNWYPEVRCYFPNDDVILVACKTDLRNEECGQFISTEQGNNAAEKLGVSYLETSARNKDDLIVCFYDALSPTLKTLVEGQKRREREFGCYLFLFICSCCCCWPLVTIWKGIRSCLLCKENTSSNE